MLMRAYCFRQLKICRLSNTFGKRKSFVVEDTRPPQHIDSFKCPIAIRKMSTCKPNLNIRTENRWKELTFSMPWGSIAAKEWGPSNGLPILAVHGWQDNTGSFDPLAALLPSNYRMICVDLPGHGLSSHFPIGFNYHYIDHLMAIKRVINQLEWEKFCYIGHSLGCGLGIFYESLFPGSIERFVGLDLFRPLTIKLEQQPDRTALGIDQLLRLENVLLSGAEQPKHDTETAAEMYTEATNGSISNDSAKILMKRGAEFVDGGNKVFFRRDPRLKIYLSSFSLEQQRMYLSRFATHSLFLTGTNADTFDERNLVEEFKGMYKRNCKSFRHVEIEGKHHFHMDVPERVLPYIVDHFDAFLASPNYTHFDYV